MEVGDLCRISIHLKMFVFLFAYEKMLNIVLTDFLLFRSQLLYSRSWRRLFGLAGRQGQRREHDHEDYDNDEDEKDVKREEEEVCDEGDVYKVKERAWW